MAQLEEITVGSNVVGLASRGSVSVVAVKWHGSSVLEVTFKDGAGKFRSKPSEQCLKIAEHLKLKILGLIVDY